MIGRADDIESPLPLRAPLPLPPIECPLSLLLLKWSPRAGGAVACFKVRLSPIASSMGVLGCE